MNEAKEFKRRHDLLLDHSARMGATERGATAMAKVNKMRAEAFDKGYMDARGNWILEPAEEQPPVDRLLMYSEGAA